MVSKLLNDTYLNIFYPQLLESMKSKLWIQRVDFFWLRGERSLSGKPVTGVRFPELTQRCKERPNSVFPLTSTYGIHAHSPSCTCEKNAVQGAGETVWWASKAEDQSSEPQHFHKCHRRVIKEDTYCQLLACTHAHTHPDTHTHTHRHSHTHTLTKCKRGCIYGCCNKSL